MTIANASQVNSSGLPQSVRTAQEAIELPEVQAMLRTLSEYGLGIFMPHMHDERTGDFQPLPDGVTQVESALEVSFQSVADVANQTNRFLPVGWFWRAGESTPLAVCEMVREEGPNGIARYAKHKMQSGHLV